MARPTALREASALALALRDARVKLAQGRRLARWWLDAAAWPTPERAGDEGPFTHRHARKRAILYRISPELDPVLEAGKRRNVALAAPAFDGVVVAPDRPLSFWRTLGRVRAQAGYAVGRELAGGCVVPALGGGLCLLSNTLFAVAALAGWRILERHPHSRGVAPGEPDEAGLDATVFWPHLDLVVAPRQGRARLSARVRDDHLEVAIWGDVPGLSVRLLPEVGAETVGPEGPVRLGRLWREVRDAEGRLLSAREDLGPFRQRLGAGPEPVERSCFTCGETECHARERHLAGPRA